MSVLLTTPIFTQRGLLTYDEVTTDDETLARLPDGELVWTPVTGISVVESQDMIVVEAPRATFCCSYDQRVWIARRRQSGMSTRELLTTLPERRQQDRVIFSGSYFGGYKGRRSHMSTPEAKILALLVAGHGEFYQANGETHLSFRRSAALPAWFLKVMLEGVEARNYGDEWVIEPSKSRRMERLAVERPLVPTIFNIDAERREEFLMTFFALPIPEPPPDLIHLACYLCNLMIDSSVNGYRKMAGTVLLQEATYGTINEDAWSVTTEAGGWTVHQDGHYMAIAT